MSILSLDNVSYYYKNRYQTVEAVKNVSCTFQQGKVYALVAAGQNAMGTVLSVPGSTA